MINVLKNAGKVQQIEQHLWREKQRQRVLKSHQPEIIPFLLMLPDQVSSICNVLLLTPKKQILPSSY